MVTQSTQSKIFRWSLKCLQSKETSLELRYILFSLCVYVCVCVFYLVVILWIDTTAYKVVPSKQNRALFFKSPTKRALPDVYHQMSDVAYNRILDTKHREKREIWYIDSVF